MLKKVTIKDVAREAGVSHATVSMVFTGEPRISESTREKVLAIARKMQYVPNLGASNLRSGKTKLVGLIVNDLANPVYGKIAQTAEKMAIEQGFQLIITDHQWNPTAEAAAIRKMISFQVRGIILCSTERSKTALDLLNQTGSPAVVAIDSWPADYTGAYVGYDVESSGRIAAEHLLKAGCRNPVLFTGERQLRSLSSFVALQKGFTEHLKASGVPIGKNRVIYSGLTVEEGHKAFHRMRSVDPTVDGIFCINDLCAYGVMGGADEVGLKVGENLAVMGIGDHFLCRMPRISLTSIRHSPEEAAQMAMEDLFESFEQDRAPSIRCTLPPELIIRTSSQLQRH